jgi:tetratricopeptide (TPR) repeat protein
MIEVNLAESLRLQQKSEEALRVVRAALARTPQAFELHSELGAVLVDLGRIEESLQAYRDALAIAPNDTDSNFSLGSALVALGRRDEAIPYLKRSLTLQPTYPKTLILLGHLALDAGRLDEARRYWQPLYDSHPEQPMARHLLALYHLRAGIAASARNDLASAEQNYRAGLAIDPDDAEIQASLGVLCLTQGRPADALAPLEAYHRLKPKDAQSSLFLGQVYAQLGRMAEARRILSEGEEVAKQSGNRVTAGHCREILDHLPPTDFPVATPRE